jgi:hypothetical protein
MAKYLYEVRLERGRSNARWEKFYNNVSKLNAKPPDYGGINNVCVISHHVDGETLKGLCADFDERLRKDITVTEITKRTLSPDGDHVIYIDLVENYFLPHDKYPNIK